MSIETKYANEDLTQFEVTSRREVVALLRSIQDANTLVSMQAAGSSESILTSVLHVDDERGVVIVDQAPSHTLNDRVISSKKVSFETMVDRIRILFESDEVRECLFEDLPALEFPLPKSMIRLQRREYYRIPTPIANPARCTIQIPQTTGGKPSAIVVPLKNVSGGGIAILDEKNILDGSVGRVYKDCRIDFPGGTLVVATLEIRNRVQITLPSGKVVHRLGCLFVDIPRPMLAAVQRYITKLEREQNAKLTGMH